MAGKRDIFEGLPTIAGDYIRLVVRKVRYSRKVRNDVQAELINHFQEALRDCENDSERETIATAVISQFGDAKLLGKLIRRGKKRCRPLWKKAIIRSFQTVFGLIGLYVLYSLWLMTGTPTIDTDYMARFRDHQKAAAPSHLNAWQDYTQAMKLLVEPADDIKNFAYLIDYDGDSYLPKLDAAQTVSMRKWLTDNTDAWQQVVTGSSKPYFWTEYNDPEGGDLINVPLPALLRLRELGKQSLWRTEFALRDGNQAAAVDDLLVTLRMGKHLLDSHSTIIEQLVGMAISNLTDTYIMDIVVNDRLPATELGRLHKAMVALHADGYPLVDFEFEKLAFFDVVQRIYTKGGPGGGHLIPSKFNDRMAYYVTDSPDKGLVLALSAAVLARRYETVAKGEMLYGHMDRIASLTPYQQEQQGLRGRSLKHITRLSEMRHAVAHFLMPSFDRAIDLGYRQKATHEAAVTVLALKRWQLDKGEYPDTLQELVEAGYLTALPDDPYAEGPLTYRKDGDAFILYSFGADFEDSGGVHDPKNPWGEPGRVSHDIPHSDHLFWPVQD